MSFCPNCGNKLPEKSYTIPNIQPSEEISLTPKINTLNKNTATDVLISFHDNIKSCLHKRLRRVWEVVFTKKKS